MKTLLIDIERSPNFAWIWSLWEQNVRPDQLVETAEVICFAAKWLGERPIAFHSIHVDGYEKMVQKAHELLSEADAVMHYHGRRFDVPHLNRTFMKLGLTPPAPFQQIDLYLAVKREFGFESNSLDFVAKELGLKGKTKHSGMSLWLRCMEGDEAAWKQMERYNKQDVRLLEQVYKFVQPWIPNHPNAALYDGQETGCPACGGQDLRREGYAYTQQGKFQRFQCVKCGKWSRSGKREETTDLRGITA